MSRFENIDSKLEELANRLGAVLTKDRPDYPEALRAFEERRIDWSENEISKAIIIQPIFESSGVDSNVWNFINMAWKDEVASGSKPKWMKVLIDRDDFSIIEQNIDELLKNSVKNLKPISENDLT